jgi:hypothetical protein
LIYFPLRRDVDLLSRHICFSQVLVGHARPPSDPGAEQPDEIVTSRVTVMPSSDGSRRPRADCCRRS